MTLRRRTAPAALRRATGLAAILLSLGAVAADDNRWSGSRHRIEMSVTTRTPEQISAFYHGRHLPAAAVAELAAHCLVTVYIKNLGDDVVWLEPVHWRFVAADGSEVVRRDRDYWNRRWRELDVPAGARATFGWTQLPESRDLQPGEPVGGNLVLVPPAGEFSLEAVFVTGADRGGPQRVLRSGRLRCLRGEGAAS